MRGDVSESRVVGEAYPIYRCLGKVQQKRMEEIAIVEILTVQYYEKTVLLN